MKKIKQTLAIKDIEKLYSDLFQSKKPFDILLPKQIKSWDFGITSLFIQFINSWLRSKSAGNLFLDIPYDYVELDEKIKDKNFSVEVEIKLNSQYSELEEIVKSDYAFPAIIMAWDKGIFNLNGKNIKKFIRPINELVINTMQSLERKPELNKPFLIQKGFKSLLTCFDHLPPEKGYLDCFYSNNEFIQSEKALSDSLDETLNYILSFSRKGFLNTSPIKADLVGIIYELMKNTHEWARTDTQAKSLNPNVRGLLIKFIKKNKEYFKENYESHKGLKNYFDSFTPNSTNELYFIEISVFDSGVGYIDKYTSKNTEYMQIEDQVQVIKNCLLKHNTSAKTLEKEHKGLGLDRIMQILDNKGLFLIRTSNAFIFRNLKKDPYLITKDTNEIELFDWSTSSKTLFTNFYKCIGSNITIVYPIIIE